MAASASNRRARRAAALALLAAALFAAAPAAAALLISEIHTAGHDAADAVYSDNDWIELHNSGDAPVDLAGHLLTDSPVRARVWALPALTLPPGGRLVVLANGNNAPDPLSGLYQASFSLANDGEYLALIDPQGRALSEFFPAFPAQVYGYSYGIPDGGTGYAFLGEPTPGEPNSATGYAAQCPRPVFSHARGYAREPFSLGLQSPDPLAEIRYTLDGSWPGPGHGTLYTGPVEVAGNTLLKAVVVRNGYIPSDPVTHTWLFERDIYSQPPAPAGFPPVWGSVQKADYAMSQSIVTNRNYERMLPGALARLPTVSVVMDRDELFGPAGLWGNARERGPEWERRISLEWITGDPARDFQVNAGMRMAGGAARGISNPKHPFRVHFRKSHGPGKLRQPVFDADTLMGAQVPAEFDTLLFRGVMNFSWVQSQTYFNTNALYFRDLWVADAQLAMGHPSTHGRPVHVFLNGLYWGVYILHEQVDAQFAADYWGGAKADWDVIKHFLLDGVQNARLYEVKDGDGAAWDAAQQLSKLDLSLDSNYEQLARMIDVDNHIDYMILNIYAANSDGVMIRDGEGNNWYGARLRADGEGFKFVSWDAEFALANPGENKADMYGVNNPATYYAAFRANREWRVRFGDRVHLHLLNGGALTRERNIERYLYRKEQFELPIVLESARWGDAAAAQRTPAHWNTTVNNVLNNFFPPRTEFVLNLFRARGLYPLVAAPVFPVWGGRVASGFPLAMQAAAGTVHYTLDGSDPRLPGGAVNPAALAYAAPVAVTRPVTVSARTLQGAEWSALSRATFTLDQNYGDLKVSEFHYHPRDFSGIDGDEFEFIELVNAGNTVLELEGVALTDGIGFTFPAGVRLQPMQTVVLVSNEAAFRLLHPAVPVAGQYTGRLRNSGERIALSAPDGTEFHAMTYSDLPPWPVAADGGGYSLEAVSVFGDADPSDHAYWRLGGRVGGTPGAHAGADLLRYHFPAAYALGGGWFADPAFGVFNAASLPWIHHLDHGWLLLPAGTGTPTAWLHDRQLGWIAHPGAPGPWFRLPQTATWAAHLEGTRSPRWFWQLPANSWLHSP